ncbi:uncharacterized protein LOC119767965 [Culex quinquefasciatus]|uniref:uncharacterized protein LOC119767965 n=1 Tax=Culex quinquefasciatus TaxID=7176 RepID=UPI0018E2BD10|nr:uncharacterized protein LOC119767965 [Culex quinquefasciatus]
MNSPTAVDVPCNGPCRKRFHPAAVNMDQVTASLLLTSARPAGLLWLCPECHQRGELQPRAGSGTDLPPELWITIFRHLNTRSMLRVRSTCRRWKDIVDQNECLRKEFSVGFEGKTMDEHFQPENLLQATQAVLFKSTITSVNGWWPLFGAELTNLHLSRCEIALPVLLGMLRHTPNLTSLGPGSINYASVEEEEIDFRLEKLEHLNCDEVFDIYEKIFPRLRKLELSYEQEDDESVCRLLQSVQETLKFLFCDITPFMLEQMALMDRLRLTEAVVPIADGDQVVQLSRIQPTIEKFRATASNEALCKIARNLTNLKEISVVLEELENLEPTFSAEMPQLTLLHLEGLEEISLNLKHFKGANLINLKFELFRFTKDSLRTCLTNYPNLLELELGNCSLESWSDIFEARLESLRRLSLWNVKVAQNVMNVPRNLPCLNELKLSLCNISADMLVELLLRCPRLEKLAFNVMDTIDNEFVRGLGRFPQLKQLTIHYCAITYEALELIVENHSHLIVDIRSKYIPDTTLSMLKYVTRS